MLESPPLPEPQNQFAISAANEGVPIAAIARIILYPFSAVEGALYEAHALGKIATLPKADWPPIQKWDERVPVMPGTSDLEFEVRKAFGLTNLETGFLVVLLKQDRVDKDRLHRVIEQQRFARQMRPDKMELTDPKMVDVMICKLRKKLKMVSERFLIKTLWGSGYYIEPEVRREIMDYGRPSDRRREANGAVGSANAVG